MEKVVLFDLDDTLVEFKEGKKFFIPHLNMLLEEFNTGIQLTEKELVKKLNQGIDSYIENLGINAIDFWKRFDEVDVDIRKKAIEEENIVLFEDTLDTLEYVKSAGYKTAIVTNTERVCAMTEIEGFGLEKYFDFIIARGDYGIHNAKPEPHLVIKALEELDAKKGYFVGDMCTDVGAGIAAGLVTILVDRNKGKMPCVPDYKVKKLSEIKGIIA